MKIRQLQISATLFGAGVLAGISVMYFLRPGPMLDPRDNSSEPTSRIRSGKNSEALQTKGKTGSNSATALETSQGTPRASQLLEVLENLDARSRRENLRLLGARWGQTSPKEGWSQLLTIPGLADRQEFSSALLHEWARSSPAEALQACTNLPDGELRATGFAAAIGSWTEQSPTEASAYAVGKLSGNSKRVAVAQVARIWAQKDPVAAANWATSESNNSTGVIAIAEVMAYWANVDPSKGAEWTASLPDGEFKDQATSSLIIEWADQYPTEAAAWIENDPNGSRHVAELANIWSMSDPEAAAQWAATLPDEQREESLALSVGNWAGANPAAAAQWATKLPLEQQREFLPAIAGTWAADDPAEALSWASTLSGEDREQSFEAVFESWAISQPDTLKTWVDGEQEPAAKDLARSHLSYVLAEGKPSEAMAMAAGILEPEQRTSTLHAVFQDWLERDPDSAETWRKNNPQVAPDLPP